MKSLVLFLFCAMYAAAQMPIGGITGVSASGGISFVGTPVCSEASGTTVNISYTPHVTGDQVFFSAWALGDAVTISSVTNNVSQSATSALSETTSYAGIYWFTSVGSGMTTVTISWSGSTSFSYCVAETSGVASTGNTAQNAVSTTGSSSPWSYTTSLSTTQANGYILAVADSGSSSAITPTATAGTILAFHTYAYQNILAQQNTAASAGSVTISGTITGPSATLTLHVALVELKHS